MLPQRSNYISRWQHAEPSSDTRTWKACETQHCADISSFSLRHFGHLPYNIVLVKPAVTDFNSLYFRESWPNWLHFVRSFKKSRSTTEKNLGWYNMLLSVTFEIHNFQGEFTDEGTETHFEFRNHECYVKAISSGNRKDGILHTLYVDDRLIAEKWSGYFAVTCATCSFMPWRKPSSFLPHFLRQFWPSHSCFFVTTFAIFTVLPWYLSVDVSFMSLFTVVRKRILLLSRAFRSSSASLLISCSSKYNIRYLFGSNVWAKLSLRSCSLKENGLIWTMGWHEPFSEAEPLQRLRNVNLFRRLWRWPDCGKVLLGRTADAKRGSIPQKSWADKADNAQNYGFHQMNGQQENALNCR